MFVKYIFCLLVFLCSLFFYGQYGLEVSIGKSLVINCFGWDYLQARFLSDPQNSVAVCVKYSSII